MPRSKSDHPSYVLPEAPQSALPPQFPYEWFIQETRRSDGINRFKGYFILIALIFLILVEWQEHGHSSKSGLERTYCSQLRFLSGQLDSSPHPCFVYFYLIIFGRSALSDATGVTPGFDLRNYLWLCLGIISDARLNRSTCVSTKPAILFL